MPWDLQQWEIGGIAVAIAATVGAFLWNAWKLSFCNGRSKAIEDNRITLLEDKISEVTKDLAVVTDEVQSIKEKVSELKGTLESIRDNIDTIIKKI